MSLTIIIAPTQCTEKPWELFHPRYFQYIGKEHASPNAFLMLYTALKHVAWRYPKIKEFLLTYDIGADRGALAFEVFKDYDLGYWLEFENNILFIPRPNAMIIYNRRRITKKLHSLAMKDMERLRQEINQFFEPNWYSLKTQEGDKIQDYGVFFGIEAVNARVYPILQAYDSKLKLFAKIQRMIND